MLNRLLPVSHRRLRHALASVLDGNAFTARRSPLSRSSIRRAFKWVVSHRNAAGVDGVFPDDYYDGDALDEHKTVAECGVIYRRLRSGKYRFLPARLGIQRRTGKKDRRHAIATVRDGAVLRAISFELREVWDQLPDALVGHRPGTDRRAVLASISRFIVGGPGFVLRFDLRGAFASVSFDRAIKILAGRTHRADLIDLVVSWRSTVGSKFSGVVEGSPLGPLLLAVVLAEHVVPNLKKAGGVLYIWGDDGLLMVRDRATVNAAYQRLTEDLAGIGLVCHPNKTGIYELDTTPQPTRWPYLGFAFRLWQPIPCAAVCAELVAKVEALVRRGDAESIEKAGRFIEGFGSYFAPGEPLDVFADLDAEILARSGFAGVRLPRLEDLGRRAALRVPSGTPTEGNSQGSRQGSSGSCWRTRRPKRLLRLFGAPPVDVERTAQAVEPDVASTPGPSCSAAPSSSSGGER